MSGLVISDSKLRDVRFHECKLDDANFRFVKAERVVLDGCSLVEADFTGGGVHVERVLRLRPAQRRCSRRRR